MQGQVLTSSRKLHISTLNQLARPYTLRKQPDALLSQPDALTSSRVAASAAPSVQEKPSANSAAGSTAAQKIGSTATQKKKNAPKKPGPPQTADLLKREWRRSIDVGLTFINSAHA